MENVENLRMNPYRNAYGSLFSFSFGQKNVDLSGLGGGEGLRLKPTKDLLLAQELSNKPKNRIKTV